MKRLSKHAKILLVIVLFGGFYVPSAWLWGKVLPSYSQFLAVISETFANFVEFSDTTYTIDVERTKFVVRAQVTVTHQVVEIGRFEMGSPRPTDLVSFNLSLWAALFLASVAFIGPSARWRYLLIAPLILVLCHMCDLTILAKNARWALIKDLYRDFPYAVDYSFNWHWFWWWALELNSRIIGPFMPLALWIVFCLKSFLAHSPTTNTTSGGA